MINDLISQLESAQSPGEKHELRTKLALAQQNLQFKQVNFGQTISSDHWQVPDSVHPDVNLVEYRKWKQLQINQQRFQLSDRLRTFDTKIGSYRSKNLEASAGVGVDFVVANSSLVTITPAVEHRIKQMLDNTPLSQAAKNARIIVEII